MVIGSTRTVVEELQSALAALQSAEATYYEKTGSDEWTDVIDAINAIDRAKRMVERAALILKAMDAVDNIARRTTDEDKALR